MKERNHVGRDYVRLAEPDEVIEKRCHGGENVVICLVQHQRLDRHITQWIDMAIDPGDIAVIDDGRERCGRLNLHRQRAILVEAAVDWVILNAQI